MAKKAIKNTARGNTEFWIVPVAVGLCVEVDASVPGSKDREEAVEHVRNMLKDIDRKYGVKNFGMETTRPYHGKLVKGVPCVLCSDGQYRPRDLAINPDNPGPVTRIPAHLQPKKGKAKKAETAEATSAEPKPAAAKKAPKKQPTKQSAARVAAAKGRTPKKTTKKVGNRRGK